VAVGAALGSEGFTEGSKVHFLQIAVLMVGLPGLEPGTSSLSEKCRAPEGRTRLRLEGTVQDPTDSVYHHLRSIPLDEMPAALYNTVDTIG
jgi:hypothetical protein